MEIKRVISRSRDGLRMEVITEHGYGILRTRHVRRGGDGKWRYCTGYEDKERMKPILRKLA